MYDVTENFYFKFIPKLMHLAEEAGVDEKYKKEFDALLAKPEHQRYKEGFDADVMKAIRYEK